MRTILVIIAAALALSAIPSASAVDACDPNYQICANVSSASGGTCDEGYAVNNVNVYHYDGASYSGAAASTYCTSSGSYSDSSFSASAWSWGSFDDQYFSANWYGYQYHDQTDCQMQTWNQIGDAWGVQYYGCPAGNPPRVPALLP